ncbi:MAG: T9SS type A sorting domain-containing protein, partial [Cyclobacteriaceae bacterium]|nr:T9SS type A sorting domain-containing protein [Cyclobacteriaceae bacterium]
IEGADTDYPINANSGNSGDKSYQAVATSVNTDYCNTLVMTFFANKKDSYWTPPVGATEVYDAPNNQNGLTSNMLAYFIQPDGGATGNQVATATYNEVWVAQQVAIKPGISLSGSSAARTSTSGRSDSGETTSAVTEDQENLDSGTLQAYPNPVRDYLTLSFEGMDVQPNSLMVMDGLGRRYQINTDWNIEMQSVQLDMSALNKGFYIIKLEHATGMKLLKVYKE